MQEYTVHEFVQLTRSEPYNYINYCEILMMPNGNVVLAHPSHSEAIMSVAASIEHTSIDDIKKFLRDEYLLPIYFYAGKHHVVSLWFDYCICSELTLQQQDNIKYLQDVGLLSRGIAYTVSNDYQNYRNRKLNRYVMYNRVTEVEQHG